jgi:glutathione S-transferase
MKLFYSATSPYTRKVLVTAMEKGLCQELELVTCNPHAAEPGLLAVNPMSRVPTLVLDDGTALYDSPVICEWLDGQGHDPRLIPADGSERWKVLRGQALADGMMDDAYNNVMEGRRPADRQDAPAVQARSAALLRCVSALEAELPTLAAPLTLAHIAAACALGYLDFRLPHLLWRDACPALAAWYADFARRPALAATRHDAAA